MVSKQNPLKVNGFSLLELLIASALVPLISFVIFSNISSGMRLWQALNQSVFEEDIALFRQKVSYDFDHAFKFSTVPFTGDPGRVSFAGAVEAPIELGGGRGIGLVSLFYDDSQKSIIKQETDMSGLFKETPGRSRILMRGVKAFEIQYFAYRVLEDEYLWGEEWDASQKFLPLAVRFVCELEGDTQTRVFTFPVRAGG